jgi:hypothetical protein
LRQLRVQIPSLETIVATTLFPPYPYRGINLINSFFDQEYKKYIKCYSRFNLGYFFLLQSIGLGISKAVLISD